MFILNNTVNIISPCKDATVIPIPFTIPANSGVTELLMITLIAINAATIITRQVDRSVAKANHISVLKHKFNYNASVLHGVKSMI